MAIGLLLVGAALSPAQVLAARQETTTTPGVPALLQRDIGNAHLHVLHALDHYGKARAGDREWLAQAEAGLATAQRLDGTSFWANYLRGLVALEQDRPKAAVDSFASAAFARPDRWEPLYGLSLAAHRAGRTELARMAAEAMLERAPERSDVLRNAAFSLAGAGDGRALALATRADGLGGDGAPGMVPAVQRIAQAAGMAIANADQSPQAPSGHAPAPEVPQQITLDVAIILNSTLKESSRGLNLLDGLTAQFGYQHETRQQASGDIGSPTSRAITRAISIPQLSYNLNLFNDSGQVYQVLARPSLTAFLGRESEFFAGRQVQVEVSGVNLGSLQPIDIGVGLKLTPEEITADKVRFTVRANRSFLSRNEVGSFEQSLTTFRQQVSATAEVRFGQTLLLSSLSESVRDDSHSRTPVLGDIPVIDNLFKRSAGIQREESLLVLVTPRPVLAFDDARPDPAAVDALSRLWRDRIDPKSDLAAINERIGRVRVLRGVERDDVSLDPLREPNLIDEAQRESRRMATR
jgi:hypothetical protein